MNGTRYWNYVAPTDYGSFCHSHKGRQTPIDVASNKGRGLLQGWSFEK
jgi:hypothetical protein